MRKVISMLFIIFISLILFGCQSNETDVHPAKKVNNSEKLSIVSDFRSVSLSKAKGVDEVTFDDQKSIDAFRSIFLSAVKEAGIVDMAAPEFHVEVESNKEAQQSLYLWIGEKGQRSTLMKAEDTHTIYTVSAEMTEQFMHLVESRLN